MVTDLTDSAVERQTLTSYECLVRKISNRLVEAQRSIRILDAVQWSDDIERRFFADGCRELPEVTRDTYLSQPLPFDPEQKTHEFLAIERDIRRSLGMLDAPGRIMTGMCQEYRDVVRMLAQRGTRAFVEVSERLYGSSADRFRAGESSLLDQARNMSHLIDSLPSESLHRDDAVIDASVAVEILGERLRAYFQEQAVVRVRLSEGIVADAAAGGDCLKIRGDARFTERDLRLLEVHEGWVHLGTTLNGLAQPVCTFLGKGPPSSTITQEGLAVLTEFLAGASHPARVWRLIRRCEAIALAEAGGNFLDIYRYFEQLEHEPRECYQHAMRIFRGSLPDGCGPFTKDLSYVKGFTLVVDFIREALRQGTTRRIPLLFCGKTPAAVLEPLEALLGEGLVAPPRFLPEPYTDYRTLERSLRAAGCLQNEAEGRVGYDYVDPVRRDD